MAYTKELEELIESALADGVLTDKKREILHRKAAQEGVDVDELDLILEGRLAKMKREEQKSKPAIPASEKQGNMVKCPSCGAAVPGGSAICSECGYEFRNVSTNRSLTEFSKGLAEINARHASSKKIFKDSEIRELKSYIRSFPVPNTSEDLLEMLAYAQPKVDKSAITTSASTGLEYWELYTNCINKAKLSFSQDERFLPYFQFFEKENKKSKNTIGNMAKKGCIIYVIVAIVMIILSTLLLKL